MLTQSQRITVKETSLKAAIAFISAKLISINVFCQNPSVRERKEICIFFQNLKLFAEALLVDSLKKAELDALSVLHNLKMLGK